MEGGGSETKAHISSSLSGAFTWSSDDRIAVHTTSGYYTLALSMGAGSGSAVFAGKIEGTRDYYAVYPASVADAGNYGDGTLKVNLPTKYYIDNTRSDWKEYYATYSPLPMIARNASSGSLAFKHVGGLFRLFLDSVPAGTKSITVTASGNIAGSFTVNTATETPTLSGGSSNMVTFTFDNALTASTGSVVLTVPVPAATEGTSYTLALTLKGSKATYFTYAVSGDNVSRGGGRMCSVSTYSFITNNPESTVPGIFTVSSGGQKVYIVGPALVKTD